MGKESSDQFHADDQQENAINQFVESFRASPIHIHQRRDTFEGKGDQAQENPKRQYAFESCRESVRKPDQALIHAGGRQKWKTRRLGLSVAMRGRFGRKGIIGRLGKVIGRGEYF